MSIKAVRLESGNGLTATFVPEAGMIGISLKSDGSELFGQRDGLESYIESGKTMGMPILYPWANRLARDSWEAHGQSVVLESDSYGIRRDSNGLAIHGTLAASPFWKLEETSTGGDLEWAGLKATLDFGAHPELLRTFPFPHRLELEINLTDDELSVTTTVIPTGDLPVPLAFGFHPYISLPGTDRKDWTVELPEMTGLVSDGQGIPTGETRPFAATRDTLGAEEWDRGFTDIREGAKFTVADSNLRVGVRFDSGYSTAQVFAPRRENLICFEPMKAPANALVSGLGLKSVDPGSKDISRFTISTSKVTGETPAEQSAAGFRFEPESPVTEVRRVARDRVRSALTSLRETSITDPATAVHGARKDLKKMRAVLRLVRGDIGKRTFKTENRRYRDAARLLSGVRDDQVLIETVESLRSEYPGNAIPLEGLLEDLRKLRDSKPVEDGAYADRMEEAAAAIEAGGGLINGWKLEGSDWDLFESGLRRSYRDGRKALAVVGHEITAETVHEWRKKVKDLWYQLRLLRNGWDQVLKGQARETGRLADMLGDHNDLAVLISTLDNRPSRSEGYPELRTIAVEKQAGIMSEALPLGHRIYTEEPDAFTSRIGAYWRS